jgi:hypothetical protein
MDFVCMLNYDVILILIYFYPTVFLPNVIIILILITFLVIQMYLTFTIVIFVEFPMVKFRHA